jgi:hypothetical protein
VNYISKLIAFLLYELETVNHRAFCRACFTASFYHKDKFSSGYFNIKKFITQIESGFLGHHLNLSNQRLAAPMSNSIFLIHHLSLAKIIEFTSEQFSMWYQKFRVRCKLIIIVSSRNLSKQSVLKWNSSYIRTLAEFRWRSMPDILWIP